VGKAISPLPTRDLGFDDTVAILQIRQTKAASPRAADQILHFHGKSQNGIFDQHFSQNVF